MKIKIIENQINIKDFELNENQLNKYLENIFNIYYNDKKIFFRSIPLELYINENYYKIFKVNCNNEFMIILEYVKTNENIKIIINDFEKKNYSKISNIIYNFLENTFN